MLNPESYKDGAIEKIAKTCETVSPQDAEVIGDIILDTLTAFKAELIDQLAVDCLDSIRDRLEQTLSLARSA